MNNQEFLLDHRLKNDGFEIADLKLSKLLLANNSLFPWVILVPKINGAKEIIDLKTEEQILLMEEISLVSKIIKKIFQPDNLNVAALGNIVAQLHIHIIARYETDTAWPNPVFGRDKQLYNDANDVVSKIRQELRFL